MGNNGTQRHVKHQKLMVFSCLRDAGNSMTRTFLPNKVFGSPCARLLAAHSWTSSVYFHQLKRTSMQDVSLFLATSWETNNYSTQDHSFSLGHADLTHEHQCYETLASLSTISANSASFACPQEFILTALHSEFPTHRSMTQSLFPRKPELHYGLTHASLLWQPVPVHLRIFERVLVICQIFTVESVNTAAYNKYQEQFHKCRNGNVLLIFKGTIWQLLEDKSGILAEMWVKMDTSISTVLSPGSGILRTKGNMLTLLPGKWWRGRPLHKAKTCDMVKTVFFLSPTPI